SEEMSLVQLFIPTEVAHDTIAELAELGNVQFKDLNPEVNPFQRSFVGEIRRIDEMARRVRFFSGQVEKEGLPSRPLDESAPMLLVGPRVAQMRDELELKLSEHEARLIQMNESYTTLSTRTRELQEARHVLRETAVFFDRAGSREQEIRTSYDDGTQPLLAGDAESQTHAREGTVQFDLEFVAGTIDRARVPTFERVLWRVLRGNLYMNHTDIDQVFIDPTTGAESMHIWHSGWEWPHEGNGTLTAVSTGHTYPFGLDPTWHGSENALVFTNSYKMKLSIILGVIHMTFACCLQIPNHLHFKRFSSIWAEFIPQLIFLESIFGYLVVMIIKKWCTDWSAPGAGNPPSLLNMLIYMFLAPGTVEDPMYAGQSGVQMFLLGLAGICVPWMLCTKPYLEWREHQKTSAAGYVGVSANDHEEDGRRSSIDDTEEEGHTNGRGAGPAEGAGEEEEHGFEMGEVVIHQVIHTIEFCLGCISNTASYLRLWALSLAHAQLSEVLYQMTIESGFAPGGVGAVLFLMFMFLMWFQLTVFILCVMEGLSAFLHALRLHWVEANGKHYEAGGYAFTPVSFSKTQEGDQ
ncbi:H(+)-transporting V0 sector ATPase subunit a, partial [Tulasnella sp. 417]